MADDSNTATQGRILHSGEHIFARSLQNLGLDIHVRKADTFRSDGKGFLIIKEKVPIEKLFEAESNVNDVIPRSLKVETESFPDLDTASSKYGNIRFNEDRLKQTKDIRIIKIGDFDVSACKNEHVDNTSEIVAFAIAGVSYLGGETTVKFKAGKDAVSYLLKNNDSVLSLQKEYNLPSDGLGEVFGNLSRSVSKYADVSVDLFMKLLEQSDRDIIFAGNADIPRFYKGIHKYMKENPLRCVIIVSKTQLFAVRGKENSFILQETGMKLLDEKAFVGEVKEDYLNGKITDFEKLKSILSSLPAKLV